MISTRLIQKDLHEDYSVGTCNESSCRKNGNNVCDWNIYSGGIEVKDWEYGTENCLNECIDTVLCSKLDTDICPYIQGENDSSWDSIKGAPNVVCKYPLDVFETLEDIEVYVNKWGKDDNYNKNIMPFFCAKTVSTCPENLDKNRFKSCSRIVSNGIDGDICREWKNENPDISDEVIINYCNNNDTEDCACVSENKDDVCELNHCINPSYLSTSKIRKRAEACFISNDEDIKTDKDNIKIESTSVGIFMLLLFLLIIILVIVLLGYKYYGYKNSKVLREEL